MDEENVCFIGGIVLDECMPLVVCSAENREWWCTILP